MQHARAYAFRQSPYDTTVFFLQTDAAAAAHPLGAAALSRVERALASCTPTEEALAAVALHERVERGSARRKLARAKQRLAGGGSDTKRQTGTRGRPAGRSRGVARAM